MSTHNHTEIFIGIPLSQLDFDEKYNQKTFNDFSLGKQIVIVLKFYFEKYQLEEASLEDVIERIRLDTSNQDTINLSFFTNLMLHQTKLTELGVGFHSHYHGDYTSIVFGRYVTDLNSVSNKGVTKFPMDIQEMASLETQIKELFSKLFSKEIYNGLIDDGLLGTFCNHH